jgi:hypothetical protein
MSTENKRVSFYAPEERHGYNYMSVDQIVKHNKDVGQHFFSDGAMQAFGSRVYEYLVLGRYFITSEKDHYSGGGRAYTIRYADGSGRVHTYDGVCKYDTLDKARRALRKIVEVPK